MKKYKVATLTSGTPKAQQAKLLSVLRKVVGIERAQLHLSTGEVAIAVAGQHLPDREDIATALSDAGFELAPDETRAAEHRRQARRRGDVSPSTPTRPRDP